MKHRDNWENVHEFWDLTMKIVENGWFTPVLHRKPSSFNRGSRIRPDSSSHIGANRQQSPCGMRIPSDIFGRWLTPPTSSVSLCFLVLGQWFPNLHD